MKTFGSTKTYEINMTPKPYTTNHKNLLINHMYIIIIGISFLGCEYRNHEQKSQINRIVFATGGCFGSCPIQVIDIDSTLIVRYHGVDHTKRIGFYSGYVTREFWDTLTQKLETLDFNKLDTTYANSVDDLSTEILIYHNGKTKHIYGQSSSLPQNLKSFYNWLENSSSIFALIPSLDSLTFPSGIEKPRTPSIPEGFRFLPPETYEK